MRKQFIAAHTRYLASKLAPWAARLARVEGGYMAFESTVDYYIWRRQS